MLPSNTRLTPAGPGARLVCWHDAAIPLGARPARQRGVVRALSKAPVVVWSTVRFQGKWAQHTQAVSVINVIPAGDVSRTTGPRSTGPLQLNGPWVGLAFAKKGRDGVGMGYLLGGLPYTTYLGTHPGSYTAGTHLCPAL